MMIAPRRGRSKWPRREPPPGLSTGYAVKYLPFRSKVVKTSTKRKRVGCRLTCLRRVLVLAASECFIALLDGVRRMAFVGVPG